MSDPFPIDENGNIPAPTETPHNVKQSWTTVFVDFYLRMCDDLMHRNGQKTTIDSEMYKRIEDLVADLLEEEDTQVLFEELVRKIEEQPILFCSFCDRCMFTARQTFMHIGSHNHTQKMKKVSVYWVQVNNLLNKMVGPRVIEMFKQDNERVEGLRLKWSSMDLESSKLRPTRQFDSWLKKVFSQVTSNTSMSNAEKAKSLEIKLREGSADGSAIMMRIAKEIGGAKTRCFPCKLIFANAAEYYEHLLTFYHLREADPLDIITLVVNAQKRGMARLQPWPEIPDATN